MRWKSKNDLAWDKGYAYAKAYYAGHGAADAEFFYVTPDGFKLSVWLSKWLNEQKQILLGNREGKTLTEEQRQKLASISFTVEGKREVRWQQRCDELLRYYSAHGNNRMPVGYMGSDGTDLYT